MAVRVVLATGLALLLAAVVFVLAESVPRAAGSNHVPELGPVVTLERGATRHCQDGETIPGDAAAVRLLVGTYGRALPEMRVTADDAGGAEVTAGERGPGGREGRVDIPIERVGETASGLRICISADGRGRTVLFGAGERVRLGWMREGSESWFELLPTIADRFGLARANLAGSLLLPVAALLLLAAWAGAVRLVLREASR